MVQVDSGRIPATDGYALVLDSAHHLELRDRPAEPRLGEKDALIESLYVALCGTDLEVIDGSSDRVQPPVILGHEWAGRVAGVGSAVDQSLIGTFVVGENAVGDSEIGFELPGGLSSHFAIPARNVRTLPPFLHGPSACLIEPLAVSVRAVRAAGLQPSDSVLVFGDGVIGLFLARVASLAAERVVLVGRHVNRLAVARRLGIIEVHLDEAKGRDSIAGRDSWSVVFEASGRPAGLNAALENAEHDARVVLVSDYGSAPVATHAVKLVRKELRLVGSNASQGAWDEAVRLASTRTVDLDVISKVVVPIDRWTEALEAAREHSAIRVVLRHRAAE